MIGYSYSNGRNGEGIVDLYWSLTTTSRGYDGISTIGNVINDTSTPLKLYLKSLDRRLRRGGISIFEEVHAK